MSATPHDWPAILAELREYGISERTCDDEGIRYVLHEAAHALRLELKPPWTAQRIHRALDRARHARVFAMEVEALAVERLTVPAVGGSLNANRVLDATLDLVTGGLPVAGIDLDAAITRVATWPTTRELADRVLRLACASVARQP